MAKYKSDPLSATYFNSPPRSASYAYRILFKDATHLRKGLTRKVGNGVFIDVTKEIWIGKEIINTKTPLNPNSANFKVADLINNFKVGTLIKSGAYIA